MSEKVLFLQEMDNSGKEVLRQAGMTVIVSAHHDDEAGYIEELKEYQPEGILCRTDKVTRAMMDADPNLRVIAKHGVGLDNIDMDYATQKGIQVVYAPFGNSVSVAEHAIFLILACAIRYEYVDRIFRDGNFNVRYTLHDTYELHNMTLGLIGCGRIGQIIAGMAIRGFNMKVIGYDPFMPEDQLTVPIELKDSQEEVLRNADFISLHLPSTPATRGSFGKAQFAMMKPTASFINCARGDVVVEADLIDALEGGLIKAAGLDVFAQEPLPQDSPLFRMPQVIMTPHTAATTEQAVRRCCTTACRGIVQTLRGQHIDYPANLRGQNR